ncbi:GNAT family N-acetyltransferase [Halorarum salinum]|uniref:GNAT family N-acetyltransferase n=1 Tax=Halorarum salinum TaxID=2743089 RepID=A0A7D5L9M1_9EURY|nr:GNAT family protein [Halobaculum salinum]QLG61334.1 GNAT family N-acetyltransferase [Halobaculum salinum]
MPGARVASGERITLRTVESEDVPFLQRAFANPGIRYPIGNPVRNREGIDVADDDAGSDDFLVCLDGVDAGPGRPDEDDVRRLGAVHVADADWRRPDLGYWLVPEVHGEGHGSEAVSLLVDHVFRTYDHPAVGAVAYDHPAVGAVAYDFNDASRGLLESLGFAEEGRIRKDRFVDGEYVDTVQYGLLRREWREREDSVTSR